MVDEPTLASVRLDNAPKRRTVRSNSILLILHHFSSTAFSRALLVSGYQKCWCGSADDEKDVFRHGSGTCDYSCSGDKDLNCGGYVVNQYNFCSPEAVRSHVWFASPE